MPAKTESTLPTAQALEYVGITSRGILYRHAVPAIRGMGSTQSRWRIRDLDRIKEERGAK